MLKHDTVYRSASSLRELANSAHAATNVMIAFAAHLDVILWREYVTAGAPYGEHWSGFERWRFERMPD